MNKSEVMDIISAKGGEALFHLSKKFLKDREIVIYALKNLRFFNEQSYSYKPFLSLLPKDKRKDREIVNLAVSFAASNYKYVHKDLQDDKYILVKAINNQRIYFDDWDKPDPDLEVQTRTLSDARPGVLEIPGGCAHGFKTLVPDTKVFFFSTSTLGESAEDDFRYPYDYWNPWSVVPR